MEAFSLQSLTPSIIPSSFLRLGGASSHVKLFNYSNSNSIKYPSTTKHKVLTTRVQASGSTKSSSSTVEADTKKKDSKDDNLVFVAGATGKVGSRTVRELIKLGFWVRAGVRNRQRAGSLVQSVEQLKLDAASATGGSQSVEKLEIVECDLEKPDQIGPALGNASTVICAIGASEKEVFDITGPYRIDYLATRNLIDAATIAKVNHFILVTSLGTNKVGFPAAILNLFWGVLVWKRKAEEALLASGLPYTIVRPGGMERPTDAYKETHNVTLSTEDTLFGGQVSNLQVAELMAVMAKNRDLACCKIVEVIAETTAPLTPSEKLLAKIPSQRPCNFSPKAPDIADVSDSVPSLTANIVVPSIATQKETAQPKPVANQPLSPYIVYDDLKPPSSSSPVQPSGGKQIKISDPVPQPSASDIPSSEPEPVIDDISQTSSLSKGLESLSPYSAYEDLKPPTSPSPTPSSSNDKPLPVSSTLESASSPSTESNVAEEYPSQDSIFFHSPYHVYPDFKPPTSPSPSAPNVSLSKSAVDAVPKIDIVSSNGPAQLSIANEPNEEQNLPEPKSRPLSPFTMYEDLKPPASPSPSFRNY
ncbi:putative NAD(P)-binding domain-containing protein [Lupinus albus]|uniref:Putative NAD(P)-binding domain-containing protein n=1 Tax=Lupinus albus TaxID=3870 RepID=A0A6A4QSZ8_LUPAL|nr:putative NAD(P)-binding domain-containing protein [Lupinus albus]